MEDILREIEYLSTRFQDNLETNSLHNSCEDIADTEQFCLHADSTMRLNRKKRRKRKSRKRRMEDCIELDLSQSTSPGNTSDELVVQDYIANIVLNASDSDLEADKVDQKPCALNQFLKFEGMKLAASPLEMAESDSFSETLMAAKSLRRRRRSKRSNKDEALKTVLSDNLSGDVYMDHNRDKRRRKRDRNRSDTPVNHDKSPFCPGTDTFQGEMMVNAGHVIGSSKMDEQQNSDEGESGLSDLGLDADDEAEESCLESSVDKMVSWWEEEQPSAEADQKFDEILSGSFPLLTPDSQKRLQMSLGKDAACKLNDRFGGVFKTNKLLEEFLSCTEQTRLFLNVSTTFEQDQALQLAALYSLQCHTENVNGNRRMILLKTRYTRHPDRGALLNFVRRQKKSKFNRARSCSGNGWDNKRQKISSNEDPAFVHPIPDVNKGSQMLRGMGWIPGTGLGRDSSGRVDPVKAIQRPRRMGLGFDMDIS